MKAYMILTEEYVVGYVKADSRGKANRIAINSTLVADGYEFIDLRALRCEILDLWLHKFNSCVLNPCENDDILLLEKLGLTINGIFYAK